MRRRQGERTMFENGSLRGVFFECLATDDPGWSLELVARATYLARTPFADVVKALRRWAEAFGTVAEERVRRVDLCADFEAFDIRAEDGDAFVRPPRSTMTSWMEGRKPGEVWHKTYRRARTHVTGHTVCPGNALMARVYDKTQELAVHRDATKDAIERAGWKQGGWTGGSVTRVEFQVRGEAAKELFERNADRLQSELSALWRYCTERWIRLVLPDEATRLRRCPTDPRWAVVQSVEWGERQAPAVRVRSRGFATAQQAWGAAVTALAQAEMLGDVMDDARTLRTVANQSEAHAQGALGDVVRLVLDRFAPLAEESLLTRAENYADAVDFVVERAAAAVARATVHREQGDENA